MKKFHDIHMRVIDVSLRWIFSIPSLYAHTIWFVAWFYLRLSVGDLTNYVSLEAIYVGILIGIQQIAHVEHLKKHLRKK